MEAFCAHDLLFMCFIGVAGFFCSILSTKSSVPFSVRSLEFHSQYNVFGSILSAKSLVPFSVQSVWFHSQYKVFGSILSTKSLVPFSVRSL